MRMLPIAVWLLLLLPLMGQDMDYETYSTKGKRKALGLNLKIDFPKGWEDHASGPATVFHFHDPDQGGSAMLIMPNVDLSHLSAEEFVKNISHSEDYAQLGLEQVAVHPLEGTRYPTVLMEALVRIGAGNQVIKVRYYFSLIQGRMVQIQFHFLTPENRDPRPKYNAMMKHIFESLQLVP